MKAVEFLRFLCDQGAPSGAVTTVTYKKKSLHIPIQGCLYEPGEDPDADLFEDMAEVAGLPAPINHTLYAHPGHRRGDLAESQRGTKRDVVALSAFVLDIDTASPDGAHKADNAQLPQGEEDVLRILEAAPVLPTVVVCSGYGYQPWWMLEEPLVVGDGESYKPYEQLWKDFEKRFLARAAEMGVHMDACATFEHKFRLPGTFNAKRQKQGEMRPVTVLDGTFERYTLKQLGLRSLKGTKPTPLVVPSPTGPIDLEPVREAMRRLKPTHKHKKTMTAVLDGESFAKKGERDTVMYAITSTIAWLSAARKKEFTAEVLAEILRPSLTVWAEEADAEKTLEEEMAKAQAKFQSALDNRAEDDARRVKDAEAILSGLRSAGAEVTKTQVNGTAVNHAIIQDRNKLYVWNFGEQEIPLEPIGYHGPIDKECLFNVCRDLWKNKTPTFNMRYLNDKGEEKSKTDKRIIEDYGTAALDMVGELALQKTHFDVVTRTLHRAVCPLRPLTSEFNPLVDQWLRLLGASNIEKFLDWLAVMPRLDEQNCALYLEGKQGVGKNLLAVGLSRFWRVTGPCKFEIAASSFNADMFSCPLIFFDEGAKESKSQNIRGQSSTFIRSLIGSSEHSLNQKNQPIQKIVGCVRVLIAANNENVLSQIAGEDLSEADLEAVAGRFLHIKADSQAAQAFLVENKARLKSWTEEDLITRHVMHLVETRKIVPGKRFLVEGETSSIHRALINRGDRNELILHWLASLVTDPKKIENVYRAKKEEALALVGNGEVLVNTKAYADNYKVYDTEVSRIAPGAASRVFANLSGGRQVRPRIDESRVRYHAINPERILEWVERTQLGDIEKMKENIERELV